MKIESINKPLYRRKANIVIVGFVVLFTLSSLAFGSLLISLFGNQAVVEQESTGNFHWNLIGVLLGLLTSVSLLNQVKGHPFFKEVVYVWQMKQLHNRILRRLKQIKSAAEQEDLQAYTILKFYYQSQKQIFELDNNTLTLDSVMRELEKIEDWERKQGVRLKTGEIDETWLNQF